LAKVRANLPYGDSLGLALAHPALVLLLTGEALQEDFKGLPHNFLTHCKTTITVLY